MKQLSKIIVIKRLSFIIIACCFCLSPTGTTAQQQDGHGFQCNKVIAEISPNDITTYFQNFIKDLGTRYDNATEDLNIEHDLQYGVRAKIICASCQSIQKLKSFDEAKMYQNNENFDQYCGSRAYGHDIEHSGLVMIPLIKNKEGNLVEKPGSHMGFVHSRGTKYNRFYVASGYQPWFGDGQYANTKRDIFMGFLATARVGVISILPDFMGYGISKAYRSYIIRDAYVTATLPLWIKVGLDLKENSDSQSYLANVAFLHGYSEGGYASIAIADGLNSALGVKIARVMVGGAPVRLLTSLKKGVMNVESGRSHYFMVAMLLGASYSSGNTNLSNFNTGQDLLDPKYVDKTNSELNIFKWINEEDIDPTTMRKRLENIAQNKNLDSKDLISELWNTDFLHFLHQNDVIDAKKPCSTLSSKQPYSKEYKEGLNDKLCEAFQENDLRDIIHNANYPIEFCYSLDDELIPFDSNIPEVHLNPEYLSTYESYGTHSLSSHQCFLNAIKYLVSDDLRNVTKGISENNIFDGGESEYEMERFFLFRYCGVYLICFMILVLLFVLKKKNDAKLSVS